MKQQKIDVHELIGNLFIFDEKEYPSRPNDPDTTLTKEGVVCIYQMTQTAQGWKPTKASLCYLNKPIMLIDVTNIEEYVGLYYIALYEDTHIAIPEKWISSPKGRLYKKLEKENG